MKEENGYIYILYHRASKNLKENIYKIGKTKNYRNRLRGYTKGSEYKLVIYVKDYNNLEKKLITICKNKFITRKDYGSEYFQCNINELFKTFKENSFIIEIIKNEIKNGIENNNEILDQSEQIKNEIEINEEILDQSEEIKNENNNKIIEQSEEIKNTKELLEINITEIDTKSKNDNLISINKNKEYICKRCGYKTEYKHCLIKHLEKITECTILLDDIDRVILLDELKEREKRTIVKKQYICKKCGKELSTRQNKWKHEKICKFKENNKIFELENKLSELTKSVETLILNKQAKISDNIIIINDLRPFGKENYEYITEEFILDTLHHNKDFVFTIFKKLHFSINHPENWNFYISNSRSNKANVYRGKRFELEDKTESIKELINNIINFCKTFVKDLENLPDIEKRVLLESLDEYINTNNREYDINNLIKSISEWAYNKKEKIELINKQINKKNREETKIILNSDKE